MLHGAVGMTSVGAWRCIPVVLLQFASAVYIDTALLKPIKQRRIMISIPVIILTWGYLYEINNVDLRPSDPESPCISFISEWDKRAQDYNDLVLWEAQRSRIKAT